jgi:hypothetical protein
LVDWTVALWVVETAYCLAVEMAELSVVWWVVKMGHSTVDSLVGKLVVLPVDMMAALLVEMMVE